MARPIDRPASADKFPPATAAVVNHGAVRELKERKLQDGFERLSPVPPAGESERRIFHASNGRIPPANADAHVLLHRQAREKTKEPHR